MVAHSITACPGCSRRHWRPTHRTTGMKRRVGSRDRSGGCSSEQVPPILARTVRWSSGIRWASVSARIGAQPAVNDIPSRSTRGAFWGTAQPVSGAGTSPIRALTWSAADRRWDIPRMREGAAAGTAYRERSAGRSDVGAQRRAESLWLVGGRAVLFDELMNALHEEVGDRIRRVPDVDCCHLAVHLPSERGHQRCRWLRYEAESSLPLVELRTRSCYSLDEHRLHGTGAVAALVSDDPPAGRWIGVASSQVIGATFASRLSGAVEPLSAIAATLNGHAERLRSAATSQG
jgi:hypothetical protein